MAAGRPDAAPRRRRHGRHRSLGARVRRVRRAQVPGGLHALRVRQPGRAARHHAAAAQPGPPHQLRQVQPVHHPRQRARGRGDLDARGPGAPVGRRAVDDVRAARRVDVRRARLLVGRVPHPAPGALLERRPGHAGGREAQLRHAELEGSVAAVPDRPRGHRAGRDRRLEDRALPPAAAHPRPVVRRRHAADLQPQVGRGEEVLRDRLRAPDRHRAVRDRQGRHAAPHRVRPQPELLGRRHPGPRRAPRPLQLRPHRLPQLLRERRRARGLQGGRVRPLQGVRRALVAAAAPGRRSGTTAASSSAAS